MNDFMGSFSYLKNPLNESMTTLMVVKKAVDMCLVVRLVQSVVRFHGKLSCKIPLKES